MVDTQLSRILFATDGSEFSAGAERVAFAMAARAGVPLMAMTVVLAATDPGGVGESELARAEAEATERLEGVERRAEAAGVACRKVIRFGQDPHEEIVAESEHCDAQVIVLGRRGKRGLARLMLGDATAKVIGAARCGVVVVPKACDIWSNRVLLATDGSRPSEAAAAAAAGIARQGNLPLTVVSARAPQHSPARQDEADKAVDRVLRLYQAEGFKADGVVASGVPAKVIAATAAEKGADLIVMGSHGRTGLGRLILGSNSERVIGEATCPVLVVKG